MKANGVIDKDISTINIQKGNEGPKRDISSIIDAKLSKLVEDKITELLGS